ncbi:MAG: exopolyphosphatase [Nitrosomonadales bacterium]|nr:MAG: exopolyphosphatase [Nitrosomonadales bacterium]
MSEAKKFRLVTRSDFDGLVCAVLLKHLDMIDDILFVHPKDMQDGKVSITANDITTNLPYVAGAHLVLDHHSSEIIRNEAGQQNYVNHPDAPSAARVVYEHFGGKKVFPAEWDGMMAAVDKADSAQLNRDEILHPTGWILLNYLMDARTGLGRFRNFRISNYDLMMDLIDYCKNHNIDQIMALPDVKERVELYMEHAEPFKEQIWRCATLYKNVVVLDLRKEKIIYSGNRFMIYALYPEANISVHVLNGLMGVNTVFAVGKSILNRTSKADIGALMLQYGGGGHQNAGTCQVANDKADIDFMNAKAGPKVLQDLIAKLQAAG